MSNDFNKYAAAGVIGLSALSNLSANAPVNEPPPNDSNSAYSEDVPQRVDPLREASNESSPVDDGLNADLERKNNAESDSDTANSAAAEQPTGSPPDADIEGANGYEPSSSVIEPTPEISPEARANTVQDIDGDTPESNDQADSSNQELEGDYSQDDGIENTLDSTPYTSDSGTNDSLTGDYSESPSDSGAGSDTSGGDSEGSSSDSGSSSGSEI